MTHLARLACACGKVRLDVARAPILSAECYCNSCREAGARIQALPSAPRVLGEKGGTRLVLYRKDRVHFVEGTELLKEFRLTPESPTRRVVASCCNSPVFLEFEKGHWLSLYSGLWPHDSLPPVSERTMTSDLPDASVLSDDVPNSKRQSLAFFARLLGAWVAMGFRVPKVPAGGGTLHV